MSILSIVDKFVIADDDERDNKEFALAAVKEDGSVLYCASGRLRDDKDVILAAVQEKGNSLKYASERLKNEIRNGKFL